MADPTDPSLPPLDASDAGGLPPLTAYDPYAGLQWPPSSWGGTAPMPAPTTVETSTPAIASSPVAALIGTGTVDQPTIAPPAGQSFSPDQLGVDAVTGAQPQAMSVADRLAGSAEAGGATPSVETETDRLKQKYAADPLDPEAAKYLSPDERAEALRRMSPQQYAAYTIGKQSESEARQHADQARVDRENADKERQLYEDDKVARAKTDAQSQQLVQQATDLANQKMPSYGDSIGLPRTIAAGIGVVMNALAMGAGTGYKGPNLALDIWNKAADDYSQSWREQMSNKRAAIGVQQGAIASQRQSDAERFHVEIAHRLAVYEMAKQAMLTEQQNYDPAGTMSSRIGAALRTVDQAQAVALQAYQQQQHKNNLEDAKDQRETFTANANAAHQKAEEDLARQKEYREATTAADAKNKDVVYSPDAIKQMYPGLPENLYPTGPTKLSQFDKVVETHAKVQGANKATFEAGAENFAVKGAVDDDGKPLQIKDVGQRKEVGKMLAGADRVNELVSKMSREIDQWGGQSDLKKSPHWQTLQSDKEALVFALHQAEGIEGFRPGTAEMLEKLTGDVDVTSFVRDARAGLKTARDNINATVNANLRPLGGSYKPPADTSETQAPQRDVVDELGKSINDLNNDTPKSSPVYATQGMGAAKDLTKLYGIASGTSTDPLYKDYAANPAMRAKALEYIRDMATSGISDELRKQAESMLEQMNQSATPTVGGAGEVGGTARSVSPDDAAPPPKPKGK